MRRQCLTCGRTVHGLLRRCHRCAVADLRPEPAAPPLARYHLVCVGCCARIALHRPEPRVPLCSRCKAARAAQKVERARRRRLGLQRRREMAQ